MKINLFLTCIFAFILFRVDSQISLVGKQYDFMTGDTYIAKWQAFEADSSVSFPVDLETLLFSSSVFDAMNGKYYLSGSYSTGSGLFEFNTATNTYEWKNFNNFSNITEIDMADGKIYNLKADQLGHIYVNRYDIATGAESLIGTINEPGIPGLNAETTCFDSNLGILFYFGMDQNSTFMMFKINVRDTEFSFTKTPVLTYAPGMNFGDMNYDNLKNTIYARAALFNSGGQYTGTDVVEINPANGQVTSLASLNQYPYFLAGNKAYDQTTGNLIMVGNDSFFMDHLIIFNTSTNTLEEGFIPDGVSEIVCDNYEFAVNNYVTSVKEIKSNNSISASPNPATTYINISVKETNQPVTVRLLNVSGQMILEESYDNPSEIILDIEEIRPGIYFLNVKNGDRIESIKVSKL